MDVSLFDFELPEAQIALRPAVPRDSARLMVVHGDGRLEHRRVTDLPEYLNGGDALLVNDTRVIPARLHGQRLREASSAKIEILLHRRLYLLPLLNRHHPLWRRWFRKRFWKLLLTVPRQ